MFYFFTVILLLFVFVCVICSDSSAEKVSYYEQLITERKEEAKEYVVPVDNSEFFKDYQSTKLPQDYGTFDFIIVGAGSSGSVLARRLSEIKQWKILLIEAGGREDNFSVIPLTYVYNMFSPDNWGYLSTPQNASCLGMIDHQCTHPRGKVLGGSSSINAMKYVRGNKEDYNKWAKMVDNEDWSYNKVLPYFLKSEKSNISGDPGYHSSNGLLNIEYSYPENPFVQTLKDAFEEIGIEETDCNGKNQFGLCKVQYNMKNGQRFSADRAFLKCSKTKNLNITINSLVTKVLFENDSKTAKGVTFIKNGVAYNAFANKEVILSAGAVNTPQVLMLSGVGPESHLLSHNIKVIQNLPVGQYLSEHVIFYGLTFSINYQGASPSLNEMVEEYLQGYGLLTKAGNIDYIGFFNPDNLNYDYPFFEFIFVPPNSTDPIMSRQNNYNDLLAEYTDSIDPTNTFRFFLIFLHPRSRGTLTLKSNSAIDFPEIDINMLTHPLDIDLFYDGIQTIFKIIKTPPFKKYNATFLDLPICKEHVKSWKKFWNCAVRHLSSSFYHTAGTARMGKNQKYAVVDSKLNVFRLKKLRVADSSVIPVTISGHLNAPSIMIGEKAADFIKNDYLLSST